MGRKPYCGTVKIMLEVRFLLSLIMRILAGIVGFILIYQSVFLYEDQEGLIKNKLEELWIRIDDLQQVAISKHTAFMNVVAGYFTNVFNKVFGIKLFSIQSICVSLCYAMASMGFMILIIPYLVSHQRDHIQLSLGIFLPCFLYGTIPIFIDSIKESIWLKVWIIGFFFLAYVNCVDPFLQITFLISSTKNPFLTLFPLMILGGLTFGGSLFTIFVMVMRKTLNYIAKSHSILRIVSVFLLNCIPLIILYLLWKGFLVTLENQPGAPKINENLDAQSLNMDFLSGFLIFELLLIICVFFINIIFVFSAGLFSLFAALMILHKAFWPILEKPLYLLQKVEITKRNKILGALGTVLVLIAIWKLQWIETAIKLISPFS